MIPLEVVDAGTTEQVLVSVTMPAVHLCPFREEVDEGTATIVWRVTNGRTIELHSLRAHMDALDEFLVSHEQYTAELRERLAEHVRVVSVVTTWATAGGTIAVTG